MHFPPNLPVCLCVFKVMSELFYAAAWHAWEHLSHSESPLFLSFLGRLCSAAPAELFNEQTWMCWQGLLKFKRDHLQLISIDMADAFFFFLFIPDGFAFAEDLVPSAPL